MKKELKEKILKMTKKPIIKTYSDYLAIAIKKDRNYQGEGYEVFLKERQRGEVQK